MIRESQREVMKQLYKAIIDKAYELDVIIEGTLMVKFDDGAALEMRLKKDAQGG